MLSISKDKILVGLVLNSKSSRLNMDKQTREKAKVLENETNAVALPHPFPHICKGRKAPKTMENIYARYTKSKHL